MSKKTILHILMKWENAYDIMLNETEYKSHLNCCLCNFILSAKLYENMHEMLIVLSTDNTITCYYEITYYYNYMVNLPK